MPSEVFLELSVGGKCLGRVYINLWTNQRWAQQFLTLCMGTLGPSYRGAMSSEVHNQGEPGENMVFPHHVESGRANEQAIFSNVELGEDHPEELVEGHLGAPETQHQLQTYCHSISYNYQTLDNCQTSGFVIYTIGSPREFSFIPFGKVFSGLDVVKAAVRHTPNSITISNCGLVLPNSLI
ncbi:hypothetical protein Pcinc_033448 [Petrolisthes cinctipes]|uniref:Uncharacterized protein n=1 Tax=Petrolisthes cinctipes TaxID=88211 RepID=A0AAE1ES87_PETCI|nr:hypothetical protein Pcinc_033448 [Petrolisthes cinctipes]